MNLCDAKTIRQTMAMFSLNFRKEFGQNFLCDRSVVEDIADNCCQNVDSTILEIGPGIGSLTHELALRYREVVAVEIDSGLIPLLKYTLGEHQNVQVVNRDVMKTDLRSLLAPAFARGGVSVCANLPYYITTPILMMLLESRLPFDYITVMVQSEVADRLCAKAGSKAYGAITAVLNYYGYAEKLFKVPADRFVPSPKVDSSVVRIRLYRERPCVPLHEPTLFRTVRAAFEQRRKTLPNALSAVFNELTKDEITEAITNDCALPADIRGERLDIQTFTALCDALWRRIQDKQHKDPQ